MGMSHETFFGRFIRIVLIFIISIALLILRPNIISLLLGWDGLGVTSYLLVVYYQSNKSYNAGIVTALTNRLGDVGILICIGIILYIGDWTFIYWNNTDRVFFLLFNIIITVSACTKRAQIPFSSWLPAAMAAPTPVSALVHSSTLVTAGVYLLIRFNYILTRSRIIYFLFIIGILTIIIAGMAAIFEIDIKKVIALSTLRQLGVIIMIIGAQKPLLAYFHLLSHAYFKAILFMCAGIVIHNIKDYQDIRSIGTINSSIPVIIRVINIANIRLCGLPFIRGFYSKDTILEYLFLNDINLIVFSFILIATILTVCYSCRLSLYLCSIRVKLESIYNINESDKFMLVGIMLLLPFSIIGGLNLRWQIYSTRIIVFIPLWLKSAVIVLITTGRLVMYLLVKNLHFDAQRLSKEFISNIWFITILYRPSLVMASLFYAKKAIKTSELSWVEFLLFKNLLILIKKISSYLYLLITSYFINSFIIFIVIFLILV